MFNLYKKNRPCKNFDNSKLARLRKTLGFPVIVQSIKINFTYKKRHKCLLLNHHEKERKFKSFEIKFRTEKLLLHC